MTRFSWIPTVLAVVLLAGAGTAHGLWTDRWSTVADLAPVYGPKAEALSMQLGDWKGEALQGETAAPGEKNVLRRYTHPATGRSVLVSLTLGKPSQVAIHTPDMCYPASGYDMLGGAITRDLGPDGTARFFAADFRKANTAGAETFRVNWTWTADGKWSVSKYPRLWYGRAPYLFKLYVIHPSGPSVPPDEAAAYEEFAGLLLAELNTRLFEG